MKTLMVSLLFFMGALWLFTGKTGVMSKKYIVVHCSDTPSHMAIGAADIDRWHRAKGWQGIGYHYVIRRDGHMDAGRPLWQPGAHTLHYNHNSVGICLIGGRSSHSSRPKNNFTKAQFNTLHTVLAQLKNKYPNARIVGHRELNTGRACPSFDVTTWLAWAKHRRQYN